MLRRNMPYPLHHLPARNEMEKGFYSLRVAPGREAQPHFGVGSLMTGIKVWATRPGHIGGMVWEGR